MHDDLVAGLPAGDALADLPDDARGVRAADVMVLVGVVAKHRHRLAERGPDVVEVHARGHHAHDRPRMRRARGPPSPRAGTRRPARPSAPRGSPTRPSWPAVHPARSRRLRLGSYRRPLSAPSCVERTRADSSVGRRGASGSYPLAGGPRVAAGSGARPATRPAAGSDERQVGLGLACRAAASAAATAASGSPVRTTRWTSVKATMAPIRVTAAPIVRPVPSAETNASRTTLRRGPRRRRRGRARAERVGDRRAGAGRKVGEALVDLRLADRGHQRAHDGDAEGAADHPAHRQHARGHARLGAVHGVHRRGAHR